MKRDAHYYAVLALCRTCGFDKESSLLIANASQFVDDAKINLLFPEKLNTEIEHDIVDGRPAFRDMATCQSFLWVGTFNYNDMSNNTCVFHFVPGCNGESYALKLKCMEESPVIISILEDVLSENDLIKLGMVLHAYMDTFSHQGFSGVLNTRNHIKRCEARTDSYLGFIDSFFCLLKGGSKYRLINAIDSVLPAYGHGQVLDFPDIPYLVWSYEYGDANQKSKSHKSKEVDNRIRFKRAFRNTKLFLENYLQEHQQFLDCNRKLIKFEILMNNLLLEAGDKKREVNWIKFLIEQGLFSINELDTMIYDENRWLRKAFINFDPLLFYNCKIDGVQLADDFSDSSWYCFYLAVKWYKEKFYKYCNRFGLNFSDIKMKGRR